MIICSKHVFQYNIEGEAPTIRTFRSELRILDADEGFYPDERPSFEIDLRDGSSYGGQDTRYSQTITKTVVRDERDGVSSGSLKRPGATERQVFEVSRTVPPHGLESTVTQGKTVEVRNIMEALKPGAAPGQNVQTVVQTTSRTVVPKGQVLQESGFIHPETGKQLTLVEAIEAGLFDVKTAMFINLRTGNKMSISEAHQRGFIDDELTRELHQPSRLRDPKTGKDLTILEALTQGVYDPVTNSIKDPYTGNLLSLQEATDKGLLTKDSASKLSYVEITAKSTTLTSGFYSLDSLRSINVSLTLCDAVEKGLYVPQTGKLTDPLSGEKMTLEKAIANKLVEPNHKEISDLSTGRMITLSEAIVSRSIDARNGTLFDRKAQKSITFDEAIKRGLIRKPTMLHDAVTEGIIGPRGQFKVGQTDQKLSLLEAIDFGLLDGDGKCVLDPRTNELLSLRHAMDRRLISAQGLFVNSATGASIALQQAVSDGLTCLVREDISFPDRFVLDTVSGEQMTLAEAITLGCLDKSSGHFVDKRTGQRLTISEAVREGFINRASGTIVLGESGLRDASGRVLTVLDLITGALLNPAAGKVIDPVTRRSLTFEEAVSSRLIDAAKATLLMSLTSLVTTTTTVTSEVRVRSQERKPSKRFSVREAVRIGLISEEENTFTDPVTGKKMSLETAVEYGFLTLADGEVEGAVVQRHVEEGENFYQGIPTKVSKSEVSRNISEEVARLSPRETPRSPLSSDGVRKEIVRSPVADGKTPTTTSRPMPAFSSELAVPSSLAPMGQDENMQSEEKEDYVQDIKDGQEHIKKYQKQEFHSRRTDQGFESVAVHERTLLSQASTKTSGFGGSLELPLSFSDAISIGLLDTATGMCRELKTDEKFTVSEAMQKGVLNASTATFSHPKTQRKYDMKQAMEENLLEATCHYKDQTGRLSLAELIQRGIVTLSVSSAVAGKIPIIKETKKSTVYMVIDPMTAEEIVPEEAERRGILDLVRGIFKNTRTGEEMSIQEATDRGFLKVLSGELSQASYSTTKAVKETRTYTITGAVDPNTKRRIDIGTALQRGVIDQANSLYVGKDEKGNTVNIPISEAIRLGLVIADVVGAQPETKGSGPRYVQETKTFTIKSIVDPITRQEISLAEAVKKGYIDQTKGLYINPATGESIPIPDAVSRHLVIADVVRTTEAADLSSSSKITTSREVAYTLKSVLDPRTGQEVGVTEAIRIGLLDTSKGEYRNPLTGEVVSLGEAIERNFVKVAYGRPAEREQTREEKVPSLHIDDEADAREEMASEEVIEERRTFQINGVADPESGDMIPLSDAIAEGLIDEDRGLYVNPLTGEKVPIPEALERGLIVGRIESMDHQELFRSTVVALRRDEIVGVFDPLTKTKISVGQAIKLGLISQDLSSYYNPATDETLGIEAAIREGLVDVVEKDTSSAARHEAEKPKEIAKAIISWSNAAITDSSTGKRISIKEALKRGMIDYAVASVLNRKTAYPEDLDEVVDKVQAPAESIRMTIRTTQLVDQTGNVVYVEDTASTMSSESTEDEETIEPLEGKLSFNAAVRLGLFDIKTGTFRNPQTGIAMSLREAVETGIISFSLAAIMDFSTGKTMTLEEALKSNLIVRDTGKINETKAASLKMVLDPQFTIGQNRVLPLNLEDSILCGLFDSKSGLLKHPRTGITMTLEAAVNRGIISSDASLVLNPATGERTTLKEALDKGYIDGKTGQFSSTELEKKFTIRKAISAGLIENTYKPDSSEVIDKNTGNWVSLEEAMLTGQVNRNVPAVFDPVTSTRVSINAGLGNQLVDATTMGYRDRTTKQVVSASVAARQFLIALPGAPVLAEKRCGAMTKTDLDTNVTSLKGARLQEKITELFDRPSSVPAIELPTHPRKEFVPQTVRVEHVEPQKKVSETRTVDTSADETPLTVRIEDGAIRSTQKTVKKVEKTQTRETVEDVPYPRKPVDSIDSSARPLPLEPPVTMSRVPSRPERERPLTDQGPSPTTSPSTSTTTTEWKTTINRTYPPGQDKRFPPSEADRPKPSPVEERRQPPTDVRRPFPDKPYSKPDDSGSFSTTVTLDVTEKSKPVKPSVIKSTFSTTVEGPDAVPGGEGSRPYKPSMTEREDIITSGKFTTDVTEKHKPRRPRDYDVEGMITTIKKEVRTVHGRSGERWDMPEELKDLDRALEYWNQGYILDRRTGAKVPVGEALARGLVKINWVTGMITDTQTNEELTPEEAFRRGLIDSHIKYLVENRIRRGSIPGIITLNQAVSEGLLIVPLSRITNPATKQRMTIEEAIDLGFVDANHSTITDPATRKVLTLSEAIHRKLFDPHSGDMKNTATGKLMTLAEVVFEGLIPEHGLPIPRQGAMRLEDAIRQGLVNVQEGTFTDPRTGTVMKVDRARELGYIIEINETEYTMSSTEKKMTRYGAETDERRDSTPSRPGIAAAPVKLPVHLGEGFEHGLIDPRTGMFTHPLTGEVMSVATAIARGFIIVPRKEEDDVEGIDFEEALSRGLIDVKNNTFTEPLTEVLMPLDAAIRKGYVLIPEGGVQLRITEEIDERMSKKTAGESSGALPLGPSEYGNAAEAIREAARRGYPPLVIDPYTEKTISLEDALKKGIIDFGSDSYVDPRTNEAMPLEDAIELGLIIMQERRDGSLRRPSSRLGSAFNIRAIINPRNGEELTVPEAIDAGIFDPETGDFINTGNGEVIPLERAVDLGWILTYSSTSRHVGTSQSYSISAVKDTSTGEWIPPGEAVRRCLLDMAQGVVIDAATQGTMSLPEALEKGLIKAEMQGDMMSLNFTSTKHDRQFSIKSVIDPNTQEELHPREAVDRGILDLLQGLYINPRTGDSMPIHRAFELGLVKAEEGDGISPIAGASATPTLETKSWVIQAVIDPRSGERISPAEAVQRGLLNSSMCQFIDTRTGEIMNISEAISRGFVIATEHEIIPDTAAVKETKSFTIKSVIDPRTGEEIPIADAVRHQIVDKVKGEYWNMQTNQIMPIDDAIEKGLIITETIESAVRKDALIEIGDRTATKVYSIKSVKDPRTGEEYDPVEAERRGLINKIQGVYMDPLTGDKISISDAIRLHLIKASVIEEPDYEDLGGDDATYAAVETRKESGAVRVNVIVDPRTGEEISVMEAMRRGLLDPKTGLYKHPVTGESMSAAQAMEVGLIQPTGERARTPSRPGVPTVKRQNILEVVDVRTGSRWPVTEALQRGLLNLEEGYVLDSNTGMRMTLDEAHERGLLITDNRDTVSSSTRSSGFAGTEVMTRMRQSDSRLKTLSLSEATRRGLLNQEQGFFIDPETQETMTIAEALDSGRLIADVPVTLDKGKTEVFERKAESTTTIDIIPLPRERTKTPVMTQSTRGFPPKMSIDKALKQGLIDPVRKTFFDEKSGKHVSLENAISSGLLAAAHRGREMSLDEAILRGFVQVSTGSYTDPSTGEQMTVDEAMLRGLLLLGPSPQMIDPQVRERAISYSEALRHGFIDPALNTFTDPQTGKVLPLPDAISLGMVVPKRERALEEFPTRMGGHSDGTFRHADGELQSRQETMVRKEETKTYTEKVSKKFMDFDDSYSSDKLKKGKRMDRDDGTGVAFVLVDPKFPSSVFSESPTAPLKELEELDRLMAEMSGKEKIVAKPDTALDEHKFKIDISSLKLTKEKAQLPKAIDATLVKSNELTGAPVELEEQYPLRSSAVTTSEHVVESQLGYYVKKPGFVVDANGQVVNTLTGVTMSIEDALERQVIEVDDGSHDDQNILHIEEPLTVSFLILFRSLISELFCQNTNVRLHVGNCNLQM